MFQGVSARSSMSSIPASFLLLMVIAKLCVLDQSPKNSHLRKVKLDQSVIYYFEKSVSTDCVGQSAANDDATC